MLLWKPQPALYSLHTLTIYKQRPPNKTSLRNTTLLEKGRLGIEHLDFKGVTHNPGNDPERRLNHSPLTACSLAKQSHPFVLTCTKFGSSIRGWQASQFQMGFTSFLAILRTSFSGQSQQRMWRASLPFNVASCSEGYLAFEALSAQWHLSAELWQKLGQYCIHICIHIYICIYICIYMHAYMHKQAHTV